jgi:hypothetical protein
MVRRSRIALARTHPSFRTRKKGMFLFKASGATYTRVLEKGVHAFQYSPAEVNGDELILLSKNKKNCKLLERQVQAVAKLDLVRPATPTELEESFPGVKASERWKYAVELYCIRPLTQPFNLVGIKGFNAERYKTVQGFARLDEGDDIALVRHLAKTNPAILLDIVNNADSPLGRVRANTR